MAARPANPWLTFAALSLLFFLVTAGTFNSLGVVLPAMVRELKWNWSQAGLGFTLLGMACGLSSVAAGALVRRIGVTATIAIGGALLIGGFVALALTKGVWVYWMATVVLGVGFSLSSTVPGTYVLTGIFRRRSTALGAYFTIGSLGGVAGPLLYNAIAPAHGWRTFWWVFAVAAAGLAALAVIVAPNRLDVAAADELDAAPGAHSAAAANAANWTARAALVTPQYYVIVGAYTMYLLINTTVHGFAVEHLIERGVSPRLAASMLSLVAFIGAGASAIGGVAGERIRPKTLLTVCLVVLIVGIIALALARAWPMMAVYAVGVGIGYGLSFVASTMLLLTYFGRRAYLELYSIMCLISTAAALGPALGGRARDAFGNFSGVFFACAFAAFVMLMATLAMTPPKVSSRRVASGAVADPAADGV